MFHNSSVRHYVSAKPLTAGLLCLLISLTGCQKPQSPEDQAHQSCAVLGPKALIGAAAGAAGGAAIGAAAGKGKGAAIGAGVGLLAGLIAGKVMDSNDCLAAQTALQQMSHATPGQPIYWSNPQNGDTGSLTPIGAQYTDATGRVCRQFKPDTSLASGEHPAANVGVTCRTPNGDWEVE